MSFLWPLTMLAVQPAQPSRESGSDWVGIMLAVGVVVVAALIGLAMRWRRAGVSRDDAGPKR